MMPKTPRLDNSSQEILFAGLEKVGIGAVAASAVLKSLESVLNDGTKEILVEYRQPYAHLPYVDAKSSLDHGGYLKVSIVTWMSSKPECPVKIIGSFCRTENNSAYEWKSNVLDVKQTDPVGIASMEKDGTIVMTMNIGMTLLRYPKHHQDYHKILTRLNGLTPNESKAIPPWP